MRFTRIKSVLFALGVLLFVNQGYALTYEITEPCTTEAAARGSYALPRALMSIGAVTLLILEKEGLPYIGSDRGFNSILRTPTDGRTLEIMSDSEMRAYGWCYEVDGRIPDELASQFLLKGPEHIRWFYGVATYKAGQWVSFCEPAAPSTPRRHCH